MYKNELKDLGLLNHIGLESGCSCVKSLSCWKASEAKNKFLFKLDSEAILEGHRPGERKLLRPFVLRKGQFNEYLFWSPP